jgi:hypothetical protein
MNEFGSTLAFELPDPFDSHHPARLYRDNDASIWTEQKDNLTSSSVLIPPSVGKTGYDVQIWHIKGPKSDCYSNNSGIQINTLVSLGSDQPYYVPYSVFYDHYKDLIVVSMENGSMALVAGQLNPDLETPEGVVHLSYGQPIQLTLNDPKIDIHQGHLAFKRPKIKFTQNVLDFMVARAGIDTFRFTGNTRLIYLQFEKQVSAYLGFDFQMPLPNHPILDELAQYQKDFMDYKKGSAK